MRRRGHSWQAARWLTGVHAFDDPAAFEGSEEEKLEKFREVRDQIDQRIKEWLAQRSH